MQADQLDDFHRVNSRICDSFLEFITASNAKLYGPQLTAAKVLEQLTTDPNKKPKQIGIKAGCIAEGMEVLTDDGHVPIESLVGTSASIPSFDPATGKVRWKRAGCVVQGYQDCIRLVFEDGRSLTCTPDHPLWGPEGEAQAHTFQPGSLVASSRQLPLAVSDIDPETVVLYAALLADGNFTQGNVTITDQDREPLRRALLAAKNLGFETVLRKTREASDCETHALKGAQEWARYWGLDRLSKDKRLHPGILFAPSEARRLFLHTFFNHDGYKDHRGTAEITLASRGLVHDIALLLRSLGVVAGIHYKRAECQTGSFDAWRLCVHNFDQAVDGEADGNPRLDVTPWTVHHQRSLGVSKHRLEKQRLTANHAGSYMNRKKFNRLREAHPAQFTEMQHRWATDHVTWSRVTHVEAVGELPTYDMVVDDTPWFICNGTIVHNTGVGKTYVMALFLVWRWWRAKGSKHLVTAPGERQIRLITFTEIRKVIMESGWLHHFAELSGMKLTMKGHPEWMVVGAAASDENALRGYHHPEMVAAVEELTGVSNDNIDTLLRTLSQANNLFVSIFNPDKVTGKAYDMFHTSTKHWPWNLTISKLELAKVAPHLVDPGKIEQIRQEYGEDSPQWLIGVLGEFPTEGMRNVFPLSLWKSCTSTSALQVMARSRHTRVIAVDFARFGGDENCIAVREGDAITQLEAMICDPNDAARRAREIAYERGWWTDCIVVLDAIGIGQGMIQGFDDEGFYVEEFHPKAVSPVDGFANHLSAAWWHLRNVMRAGGHLPDDSTLKGQLITREYDVPGGETIEVETKTAYTKRMGKSPDRADAVVMAFSSFMELADLLEQPDVEGIAPGRPDLRSAGGSRLFVPPSSSRLFEGLGGHGKLFR